MSSVFGGWFGVFSVGFGILLLQAENILPPSYANFRDPQFFPTSTIILGCNNSDPSGGIIFGTTATQRNTHYHYQRVCFQAARSQ
ncbi:6319_t:CDS:2 [Funneliformis mosseae]|uniref:6319_t:CDS:1 n=1 Tax=Funneliformis mosseae TaxID=27381 RepID=A0A9N9D7R8_FUNMO|nr:6319_t:CDS:2 [Funneliformis mosseae]